MNVTVHLFKKSTNYVVALCGLSTEGPSYNYRKHSFTYIVDNVTCESCKAEFSMCLLAKVG
jgi:hypothetical protein